MQLGTISSEEMFDRVGAIEIWGERRKVLIAGSSSCIFRPFLTYARLATIETAIIRLCVHHPLKLLALAE